MSDVITPIIGEWTPLRVEKHCTITSDQAKKILELCHLNNRPASKFVVSTISKALLSGNWIYNGESIIFANNGVLLDGLVRLIACAETGKPLITNVAFGVDPDIFDSTNPR